MSLEETVAQLEAKVEQQTFRLERMEQSFQTFLHNVNQGSLTARDLALEVLQYVTRRGA